MSHFPIRRLRRLSRTPALRRLVQETQLAPAQLVWPLFVCHGEGVRREVPALPGVYQTSVDEVVQDAERARRLGLGGIILFGLPAAKDATGSEAYDEQGIVQQAARAVKRAAPELLVIGDVCLCEYTDHGHCGVVQDGDVDNDASVYLLGKVAVTQARAGIDIVAPSDMMDGRVAGIRKALDAAGFSRLPIMSYAAKMASAFYGPFREAAGSTPQFGDRQSYQMQGTNADEAMREIRLDVEEGADIILVKPALPCLDLIRRAKQEFGSPLAAYQVSGEYAMIKAAAARGMLDEARAMWETLYAIRRAGADIILSYFAPAAEIAEDDVGARRPLAARSQHDPPQECSHARADHGADPVDRVGVPLPRDQGRSDRACGIHHGSGEAAAHQRVHKDREADAEARDLRGLRRNGRAEHGAHQKEGEQCLDPDALH